MSPKLQRHPWPSKWKRGIVAGGERWGPWIPWIPWPFTPGAVCVAMASDFRGGGAFFLTGTSFTGNAG